MKNFIVLAGLPQSGTYACAWLLKKSGYIAGIKESYFDETQAPEYDSIYLKDNYLTSRYAPFVHHGNFDDQLVEQVAAEYMNELRAAISHLLLTVDNFLIIDTSFMYIVPLIFEQIKDKAKLIVVNKDYDEMFNSLKSTEGFESEYIQYNQQVTLVKDLFVENNRPILNLNFSDFSDINTANILCDFANVSPTGEILDLSWLNTIIESFER